MKEWIRQQKLAAKTARTSEIVSGCARMHSFNSVSRVLLVGSLQQFALARKDAARQANGCPL